MSEKQQAMDTILQIINNPNFIHKKTNGELEVKTTILFDFLSSIREEFLSEEDKEIIRAHTRYLIDDLKDISNSENSIKIYISNIKILFSRIGDKK